MIYRSNLTCPDLTPQFAPYLESRPRHWSMGHDVPSDREFEPECTSLTHDEAAILHHCALRAPGRWMDLGCRFGWSTAHIEAGMYWPVWAVDQALKRKDYLRRFQHNIGRPPMTVVSMSTQEFFAAIHRDNFAGAHIDANHDPGEPLKDAQGCVPLMAEDAVIVLHDGYGAPIQEAVLWLMSEGWEAAAYATPNGMFACWRGASEPPKHTPDPAIDWDGVLTSRLLPELWSLIPEAL